MPKRKVRKWKIEVELWDIPVGWGQAFWLAKYVREFIKNIFKQHESHRKKFKNLKIRRIK